MNYKIPGLFSLILVGSSLTLGGVALFLQSIIWGIVYLVFTIMVFINIMNIYCRKCPHASRGDCRHVIIGLMTAKLFNLKRPSAYTIKDYIFSLLPIVLLMALPQYALAQNIYFLAMYWGLIFSGFITIRAGVCKSCQNKHCSFCPNASTHNREKSQLFEGDK